MENNESSSMGCGCLGFCILSDMIVYIFYWDEVTKSEYWPYGLVVNIVILLILIIYNDRL